MIHQVGQLFWYYCSCVSNQMSQTPLVLNVMCTAARVYSPSMTDMDCLQCYIHAQTNKQINCPTNCWYPLGHHAMHPAATAIITICCSLSRDVGDIDVAVRSLHKNLCVAKRSKAAVQKSRQGHVTHQQRSRDGSTRRHLQTGCLRSVAIIARHLATQRSGSLLEFRSLKMQLVELLVPIVGICLSPGLTSVQLLIHLVLHHRSAMEKFRPASVCYILLHLLLQHVGQQPALLPTWTSLWSTVARPLDQLALVPVSSPKVASSGGQCLQRSGEAQDT
jgi:hypothetical protein